MAKDSKFGTFGGVFTPSVLTILGVIMYMRLPMVVGNGGLWAAIGIVLVAHVISVITGLSIASIATDKSVGAGGPYYIVSRSLGLPLGGTLGLALFLGISFSISLYIIGFCESFLPTVGLAVTPTNIRVWGSAVMLLLTIVTLISTSLAIKTQYVILFLIGVSLISIFFGDTGVPDDYEPSLAPLEGGESIALLFGIFFPAVTGFTAGVNMSGDLRDPKKSIPSGTMGAIITGLLVYVGLTVFLAFRVGREALLEPGVLLEIALWPPAVTAGIWGATLSSALGSILGAPRILQALAGDRIAPRFFAKGHGPGNEPRNALILAFAIGEAGILIAELNAIARIVSMVFLATYAFLNLICAIERWASPDFRPDFKIPIVVSVLGALTAVLVMIQVDLVAMAGSAVFLGGIFFYLQRRQLTLDSGDTREGIWASVVRAGLHRLSYGEGHQRNWRPNVLVFEKAKGAKTLDEPVGPTGPIFDFAQTLISGRGVLTHFEVMPEIERRTGAAPDLDIAEPPVGVFSRRVFSDDPLATVESTCQFHGFAGVEPNTVLLNWYEYDVVDARFSSTADRLIDLDFNVLLYAHDLNHEFDPKDCSIDVWWSPRGGNLPLSLSLIRFLTASDSWREAKVRFVILAPEGANADALRSATRRLLEEARVEAQVKLIHLTGEEAMENDAERIAEESASADLTIAGFPRVSGQQRVAELGLLRPVVEARGHFMLLHGSSSFQEVFSANQLFRAAVQVETRTTRSNVELLRPLVAPSLSDIAVEAESFSDQHMALCERFHDEAVSVLWATQEGLFEEVKGMVRTAYGSLEKALPKAGIRRRRDVIMRVQSKYLNAAQAMVDEHLSEGLGNMLGTFELRTEAMLEAAKQLEVGSSDDVAVRRAKDEFAAKEDDERPLKRIKRRRRFWGMFRRESIPYRIPTGALRRHYVQVRTRDLLLESFERVQSETHKTATRLGKILNASKTSLSLIADQREDEALGAFLVDRGKRALAELENDIAQQQERLRDHHGWLVRGSRELAQAFADDLDRIDVRRLTRKQRKTKGTGLAESLAPVPKQWEGNQRALHERAKLGLQVSRFQHKLALLANRRKRALAAQISGGAQVDVQGLRSDLQSLVERLDAKTPVMGDLTVPHVEASLDGKKVIDELLREVDGAIQELPEQAATISDASISALSEGRFDQTDSLSVSVQGLVQFLVESEFIGGLQEQLHKVRSVEQRLVSVAADVARLANYSLGELRSAHREPGGDDLNEQTKQALVSGLERLDEVLEELKVASEDTADVVDQRLEVVLDRTDPYELTGSSESLGQYIRGRQEVVSRLERLGAWVSGSVRQGMVGLVYRRSSGVIMAERLRARAQRELAARDGVLELVTDSRPSETVLEELPFYYRQVFLGQSTVNETFWVGRTEQLAQAERALENHRRGFHGALIIQGDPSSGKSALAFMIGAKNFAPDAVHRVFPPSGGSVEPRVFREALAKAVGSEATEYPAILRDVATDGCIILHDAELWWERSDAGLAVFDDILRLIDLYGDKVCFVLEMNRYAYRFISRFRPLVERAIAVIECGAMDAESLQAVITLRQDSTGLGFALDSREDPELSRLALARLFTKYYEYTGGNVGASLRAWAGHIREVEDERIVMERPAAVDLEVLDQLDMDLVAILLQLVLHRQLGFDRLERVSQVPVDRLLGHVRALERMGLVTQSRQGVVELERFTAHHVHTRLLQRRLIAR